MTETAQRAVQGRRVAQVPARERAAGVQAGEGRVAVTARPCRPDRSLHDHLGRHATPAGTTSRTASTSTRSTSTTSTRGATSTRTRGRTCATRPARPQLGRRAAQRRPGRRRRRRRGDLPEHGAAVLPELRAVRAAAQARGLRAPARRHPGAQPLAGRLLRAASPSGAPASARSSSTTSTTRSRTSTWIKEHGLRGGVLLPNVAPDVEVGEAALRPRLRPAVGGAARTSRSRSTRTAAPAHPTTAATPSVPMIMISRGAVLLAAPVRAPDAVAACSSGSRG